MNVSSQTLRRRQSTTGQSTHNRPLRRAPNFKKRSRSSLDLKSASSNNDRSSANIKRRSSINDSSGNIFDGVVACLSGQTEDVKLRIHDLINNFGGSTQGRFDPSVVTHLILDEPVGSKYVHWKRHSSHEWAKKLFVVKSSWVEACHREGKRVPEEKYNLQEEVNDVKPMARSSNNGMDKHATIATKEENHDTTQKPKQHSLPKQIQHMSVEEKCDWMIQQPVEKYCNLFTRQSFILVGFDNDNDISADTGAVDSSRLPSKKQEGLSDGLSVYPEEYKTLKGKLSKLVRRAGGTIFWEPNEWITAVVLNENYSKHTWDDVRYFCREHPRGPLCVSVDWILMSIYHQTTFPAPFPPEPQAKPLKRITRESIGDISSNIVSTRIKSNKKPKQSASSTFRGDIFGIVPLKTMPGTLDFSLEEMQSTVTSSGGLVLSKSLLLAIKKDAMSTNAESSYPDRKYYVVTPRSFQVDFACPYQILAELSKLGIKVVLVSPVWVAACIENDYKYDPEEYPLLFQPQTWSIRLLNHNGATSQKKLLISVTGFLDSSRYGIMAMLNGIGAEFTDNLSRKNTHLICKEGQGKKYKKALEWGIHAVSIEWLYHIIRHGFVEGSEERFSLSAKIVPKELPQEMPQTKSEALPPRQEIAQPKSEALPPRQESPRRGKRDPPQSSPKDSCQPLPSTPPKGDGRRLQFALQALEAPPAQSSNSTNDMITSPRRRGKRDRSPLKANQGSPSLLASPQQQSEGEDSPSQMETQYTLGTVLAADADICGMAFNNKKPRFSSGDEEVPLSQADDAEDNGESQVVWFGASRG